MTEVSRHLFELAEVWLDCICSDNKRRFDCCSDSQNNDFVLQSMIEDSLNIQDNIQAEM